jgi:DNA-binding NarL/FixJ family response regulator
MAELTTVVLVDDHPVVRSGLRMMLEATGRYEIVAEAEDGETAVDAVVSEQPDVVVMDLDLPGMDGIEATRRIQSRAPSVAILVLSMLEDDASVLAAMRAGARGYSIKGAQPADVVRAIDSVARGDVLLGPPAARLVLSELAAQTPRDNLLPMLSPREIEVLRLLASGASNPEIARRLGMRPKTARNHVSNIFTKLAVADRAEAVRRAHDAGLT